MLRHENPTSCVMENEMGYPTCVSSLSYSACHTQNGLSQAKLFSVEGSNRSRRHRHVTVSPSKHSIPNDTGDVTKIELELEEAPNAILTGPMPSELDATVEINSTYPDGLPGAGPVVVRAEEALIVVLVLLIWVAAIALFFNRWGKIRMLEPYQPKFQQQHRQSCAMIEQTPVQSRSFSKYNIHCMDHVTLDSSLSPNGMRPRQNSVFIDSNSSLVASNQDTPRRTKSAFDVKSLVLAECTVQDYKEVEPKGLRSESSRLLQDRRKSVCQMDRSDIGRPVIRERGMSVCQFDVGKYRDRGMSFCQFDRMDVLARHGPKDRGSQTYHFDRMDVLARPYPGRLLKDRRVSVCNFVEKDELGPRGLLNSRPSIGVVDTIEKVEEQTDYEDIFAKCTPREKRIANYQLDQPSCSKSTDVALGYKATCV